MKTTFTTTIQQAEDVNATGIPVPAAAIEALGGKKRPAVIVTIGDFTYRSTVAGYGDVFMIPLSQERRAAAGIRAGDTVEVTLELDTEPRTVDVPDDLAAALAARPGAREAFDKLAPSARKEHVRQVETAKAQETRERRIAKIVDGLGGS
ncbi:MAG: DUF1905 domain-containing protein [Anaerolineae bacterium]|nr:DUF1905 domain-containing protein [Anaerolineae bacterium]